MMSACCSRKAMGKVTFRQGKSETEINFVLIRKEHHQLMKNLKAICGEF